MDPDKLLEELREWSRGLKTGEYSEPVVHAITDSFDALDEWLTRGGFLPAPWRLNQGVAVGKLDGDKATTFAWFTELRGAEAYIAEYITSYDPEGVEAGHYYIDGPGEE